MCGSKESCSHEKQAKENIDEVEYDQPQKNASAINKHILGGRCASRFGCGCLWATTTIFVVIVALLLFFSQALNFTCGVLTLPPSQIMSTTADFFGDPDAANSTNQVNAMQQASEALLKGDSMSISKLAELFGASDAALNTSGASDVVDKLADSVNVDNIQVNLRNVSGALNRSRADNEKRMHSDKDMALGKAACDTCNKAKDASDMYNRTGFTKVYEALTSQNCAVNCISSGSYCQVTFCQAYNLLDATNTMYNNISTGFSKMLIVLNNVDTEFEGLKNMIQEKKGSLNLEIASLDSCLNDIDISVFKKSFDGIMNPLCYHFSVGFGLLSWCCFAFCCSSVILVSVQVCIHVRMAGIGQQKNDLYSFTPNNDDKDEDAQAYEDYKKKDPSISHTEIELANRASLRQSDIEV